MISTSRTRLKIIGQTAYCESNLNAIQTIFYLIVWLEGDLQNQIGVFLIAVSFL
jgi:hypothetical protein